MKGFTLLEMLVVVLMIGILSAVALPQYQKSVEKARAAEAVLIGKALQDAMQRYKQEFPENPLPTNQSQIADVRLTGGVWKKSDCSTDATTAAERQCFVTKHFSYQINSGSTIDIARYNGNVTSVLYCVQLYSIPQADGSRVYTTGSSWAACMAGKYAPVCKLFDQ